MSKPYFNEVQKFRQPWMMAVIFSPFIIWIFVLVKTMSSTEKTDSESAIAVILAGLIMAGLTFLLFKVKLETGIRKEGIYYRFFPFHFRKKLISKAEIRSFEVRQYKPITEYGGWGIRPGIRGRGRAYNVSGNMGLQLYLTNGKKLLIGTQKPSEIGKAMEAMMANDS